MWRAIQRISLLLCFALSLAFPFQASEAQTLTPIYTFLGRADGASPQAEVVLDPAGNVYGTTTEGGSFLNCDIGCGVVFKVDTRGHESVLYTFTGGIDGDYPEAGLVRDSAGVLYGAPFRGGANGASDVFKLTPRATFCPAVLCPWNMTILYSFGAMGGDGANVSATLLRDPEGNFYGANGPTGSNYGTVFKIDPEGNETILHTFMGPDGEGPNGALIRDAAGDLYGTTLAGGGGNAGVVFELTPTGSGWTETILYSFGGDGVHGAYPLAGVILDEHGNLYGTTSAGGLPNHGIVFELTPSSNGTWTETVLHAFNGSPDGDSPLASVIMDSQGNLYGTTALGGLATTPCRSCGVIYKIDSSHNESILWSFTGSPDGEGPRSSLVMDAQGNFYGTTIAGGNLNTMSPECGAGCGVVFKFAP
jgi:uncharacterized repeat protein (TIGR03803 family)